MGQRSLKDATITILDGDSNEVEVKIGQGTFTFSEKRNIEYVLDRGQLDITREGDDVPIDVSFDFVWDWIKASNSGDNGALRDIIKGSPPYVSTGGTCEPYACDISVLVDDFNCSGTTETITLTEFRYEDINYNIKDGTISVSGKCNMKNASVA